MSNALLLLAKALGKRDDDVKMAFGKSCVTFQCGDVTIFSRLVDGRFPVWRKHIPNKREEACAVVDSAELLSAIKRAMITTSDYLPEVTVVFDNDQLRVLGNCPGSETTLCGKSTITIPASFTGQASFRIDPMSVIDFLSAFHSDTLSVYAPGNDGEPVMFCIDDDYTYLAMPITKSVENTADVTPEAVTGIEVDCQEVPDGEPMKEPDEVPYADKQSDPRSISRRGFYSRRIQLLA